MDRPQRDPGAGVPLNVLIVDRAPPTDLMQGNALIAANVLPRLQDVELTLVAPVTGDADAERATLGTMFAGVHLVPRGPRVSAIGGSLEPSLARFIPRTPGLEGRVDLVAARALRRTIDAVVRSKAWDVIHVRQLPMAGYVRPSTHGRLLELIDSETLATGRQLGTKARVRGLVARGVERRALATADIVTLVSPVDAAAIRRLDPRTRVEVVTNGVDTEIFSPTSAAPIEEVPDTIAFVGAMSFPPNVDAAIWLCREVLPILQRRRPTARVRLIGRDPSPAVQALAGPAVEVTGLVADVRPEILACPIVAIPMVSGSGVKNKVLEAMSMARPIVSTTLGVESLDVVDGRHVVVADGPAAFAAALDHLLDDGPRRARLGTEARAFVVEHHSWDASARRYRSLYEDLAALSRQRRI
ncbi:MAG: glycosyltransferase [Candidatus Limnocylindrales bacterium]